SRAPSAPSLTEGRQAPARLPTSGTAVLRERLRLATPACDSRSGHAARTRIAQVGCLRSAARVVEGDTHHRTLSLLDLGAALVADKDCLSCHDSSSIRISRPRFLVE